MKTRKQISCKLLRWILHSEENYRYELSFKLHLPDVYEALLHDWLILRQRKLPKLPIQETEEEKLALKCLRPHHAPDECRLMARVLYHKFSRLLQKNYKIIDSPKYCGGIADVGLIKRIDANEANYETIIAVEVGEVRAGKPLDAFLCKLKELWVLPLSPFEDAWVIDYKPKNYYVFKRGKKWNEYIKHRERKQRQMWRKATDEFGGQMEKSE